jgi:hypothetical protein
MERGKYIHDGGSIMIVITSLSERSRFVCEGDEFRMTITDNMGCEVVIREIITVSKTIDFIATYRFALEDGTCPGFHLCGIFGVKKELPKEIEEATMLGALTSAQYENFANSVGVRLMWPSFKAPGKVEKGIILLSRIFDFRSRKGQKI